MATNIDKALYQAPIGMDQEEMDQDIEIEIEDPESVTVGIGGLEIQIEPDVESTDDFDANLAEYISEDELTTIAGDLLADYDDDVSSRKDWMQTYVDCL
jgi:hypothetical protein